MKISFTFDPSVRSFSLSPEDSLETCLMEDMATLSEKGASITLKKLEGSSQGYSVELRVGGK